MTTDVWCTISSTRHRWTNPGVFWPNQLPLEPRVWSSTLWSEGHWRSHFVLCKVELYVHEAFQGTLCYNCVFKSQSGHRVILGSLLKNSVFCFPWNKEGGVWPEGTVSSQSLRRERAHPATLVKDMGKGKAVSSVSQQHWGRAAKQPGQFLPVSASFFLRELLRCYLINMQIIPGSQVGMQPEGRF